MTGDDWKLPELQTRYAGHFSPYIQRRIEKRGATSPGRARPSARRSRKPVRTAERRVSLSRR